jgi:2,5-furandicarboxylate decarboxylase 1
VGPYITAGMVTTVDPDSGEGNIALQRCWVKASAELGLYPADGSDNWRNIMKWWERGEDAPIAVWLGHHPGVYLGGQSYHRIPYPKDHYPFISGLLGEPLRVTATRQFGERLKVPADAEVVIEGVVPRGVYRAEGPFGERPGYTGGQRPNPIIEVRSVSHRQGAIWQDILVGHSDNIVPAQFSIESLVYSRVRAVVPEVLNVRVARGFRDEVYLQIRKMRAGSGREAGIAALGTTAKFVYVFDQDVDIFDDAEVRWAIGTRSQWDRDLVVVSGVPVIALDPSVPGQPGIGSKAMVDCTMPPPAAIGLPPFYPPRNQVPDEAMQAVAPVVAKVATTGR